MSNAMIGYDTRFAIEDAPGSGVFVELAEVFEVTPPSATVNEVEVTHMQSPGRRREFIAGLIDSGTASLQMNYVPGSTSDSRIEALRSSGDIVAMKITYPNGVTVTFDGFVQEYTQAIPLEDRLTATASLRVTGDVTVSSASAPVNVLNPQITGTAKVGQTLTVWPGEWTGGGAFTYQWEADGTPVSGATGATWTPLVGNVGDLITCVVTCTNSAGSASAESFATEAVVS